MDIKETKPKRHRPSLAAISVAVLFLTVTLPTANGESNDLTASADASSYDPYAQLPAAAVEAIAQYKEMQAEGQLRCSEWEGRNYKMEACTILCRHNQWLSVEMLTEPGNDGYVFGTCGISWAACTHAGEGCRATSEIKSNIWAEGLFGLCFWMTSWGPAGNPDHEGSCYFTRDRPTDGDEGMDLTDLT